MHGESQLSFRCFNFSLRGCGPNDCGRDDRVYFNACGHVYGHDRAYNFMSVCVNFLVLLTFIRV